MRGVPVGVQPHLLPYGDGGLCVYDGGRARALGVRRVLGAVAVNVYLVIAVAVVAFFYGWMAGEVTAMRRERKHQEGLWRIRRGLPYDA